MEMSERTITLNEEQNEAFERAVDMVEGDVDDGLVEADCWGASPTHGEVVRILAEAYTGGLDVCEEKEGSMSAVDSEAKSNLDELKRDETEVLVDDTVEGVVFNITSKSVVVRQKDANGPMVRVPKEDLDERLEVVG